MNGVKKLIKSAIELGLEMAEKKGGRQEQTFEVKTK